MSAPNLPVGQRLVQRGDGKLAVIIQTDIDGVARICPVVAVPDPPRQGLFSCPCCGRPFIFSEHSDGRVTLEPAAVDDVPF